VVLHEASILSDKTQLRHALEQRVEIVLVTPGHDIDGIAFVKKEVAKHADRSL
jgi:hypothetical protein